MDNVTDIQRKLSNLARENARLRKVANRLRAQVAPGKRHRIVDRATDDATLILHLRHAGVGVSRRWLADTGLISAWRYGWALGLLRYARLDSGPPGDVAELDEFLRRLRLAAKRLVEDGDDYMISLRARAGKRYLRRRYS